MQQQSLNDQEFVFNGLQFINPNLLSPTCLQSLPVSEMQNSQQHPLSYNVMLNQQGLMIPSGQQNLNTPIQILDQQNLVLNQQANSLNQFYPQNPFLSSPQMYLAHLLSVNNSTKTYQPPLQNCMQTILMAPTNLIPSTIIGTIPTNQNKQSSKKNSKKLTKQLLTKENRETKLNRTVKKLVENNVEDNELDQEICNLNYQNEINRNESESDETVNEDEAINEDTDESSDEEINENSDDDEVQIVLSNNKTKDNQYGQICYDEDSDNDNMVHDISFSEDDDDEDQNESLSEMSFNDNHSISNAIDSLPDLSRIKREKVNDFRKINFKNLSIEDRESLILEINEFADEFRKFRRQKDMSQDTASKELSQFMKFSQSKLCRFEKFYKNTEPLRKNLKKLRSALMTKEILEKYMLLKLDKINQLDDLAKNKQRKKRVTFTAETVKILNDFYGKNRHPSDEVISELSNQTKYSFNEIKVWFNNRRQNEKPSKSRTEQSD